MTTIETTAKTADEAIEIALKELDAERGEVEIDVVSKGKGGVLGIGSEPARVRVTVLESPSDVVTATGEVLRELIDKLGVLAVVNLKRVEDDELGGPVFNIEGDDSGLLIGRRGETLRGLQVVVRCIVGRRIESRANLTVDVEGYQERRHNALTNLAQRVAQRVVTTRRSIALEPMPANERRIVHMAVADNPSVTTESTGAGDGRQVVVQLREQEAPLP